MKRMTVAEFLTQFANQASPSQWKIDGDTGSIRHRKTGHCPVSWMLRGFGATACATSQAGESLGLSDRSLEYLINAADNSVSRWSTIRKAMKAIVTT